MRRVLSAALLSTLITGTVLAGPFKQGRFRQGMGQGERQGQGRLEDSDEQQGIRGKFKPLGFFLFFLNTPRINANGDQTIDAQEAGAIRKPERKQALLSLDQNGDGTVTGDEARGFGQTTMVSQLQSQVQKTWTKLDKNGDGAITPEELKKPGKSEDQGKELLSRFDTNANGRVDPEEGKVVQDTLLAGLLRKQMKKNLQGEQIDRRKKVAGFLLKGDMNATVTEADWLSWIKTSFSPEVAQLAAQEDLLPVRTGKKSPGQQHPAAPSTHPQAPESTTVQPPSTKPTATSPDVSAASSRPAPQAGSAPAPAVQPAKVMPPESAPHTPAAAVPVPVTPVQTPTKPVQPAAAPAIPAQTVPVAATPVPSPAPVADARPAATPAQTQPQTPTKPPATTAPSPPPIGHLLPAPVRAPTESTPREDNVLQQLISESDDEDVLW